MLMHYIETMALTEKQQEEVQIYDNLVRIIVGVKRADKRNG